LVRLIVDDFNRDAGTIRISTRKGDGTEKVYDVHLAAEGVRFFKEACLGRAKENLIFRKADGTAWQKSNQARPMKEASKRASISYSIPEGIIWLARAVKGERAAIATESNAAPSPKDIATSQRTVCPPPV
jgi:hypothetical protein